MLGDTTWPETRCVSMRMRLRRAWYVFLVLVMVTGMSVTFWISETEGRSRIERLEQVQRGQDDAQREDQRTVGTGGLKSVGVVTNEHGSIKGDVRNIQNNARDGTETARHVVEDKVSGDVQVEDRLKNAGNYSTVAERTVLNSSSISAIALMNSTEDEDERIPHPPSRDTAFSFLHRLNLDPDQHKDDPIPTAANNSTQKLKTILLWTWLYSKEDWVFGLGQEPFLKHCPMYNNCRISQNQHEIDSADAVMFFVFAMTTVLHKGQRLSEVLPPRGHRDQVYVFWNDEPPRPAFGPFGTLKGLKGMFNITVTYRSDSTIPLPIFKAGKRYAPTPPLDTNMIMKNKTKVAAWVVSACEKSHSYRFEYAEELRKYMDFDVYGKCGNLTCTGEGFKCFEHLQQFYKFYFAFENSYCVDYITEKAFRTLQGNWVPVVLGGGNYTEHLPPHSFIDVRDFKSPKHLAEYLTYLDENDEEYLKYLEYKRYYRINRRQTKNAFCKICEMLNKDDPGQYERDLDPHEWWEAAGCIKKYYVPRTIHLTEK